MSETEARPADKVVASAQTAAAMRSVRISALRFLGRSKRSSDLPISDDDLNSLVPNGCNTVRRCH